MCIICLRAHTDPYFIAARISCPRPRTLRHQDVTWSGIDIGDTAEITCHGDRTLQGGGRARTVVCQNTGHWSAHLKCSGTTIIHIFFINNFYDETSSTRRLVYPN